LLRYRWRWKWTRSVQESFLGFDGCLPLNGKLHAFSPQFRSVLPPFCRGTSSALFLGGSPTSNSWPWNPFFFLTARRVAFQLCPPPPSCFFIYNQKFGFAEHSTPPLFRIIPSWSDLHPESPLYCSFFAARLSSRSLTGLSLARCPCISINFMFTGKGDTVSHP